MKSTIKFVTGFNKVYVKIHEQGEETVVAMCDYELIGKKIVDKDKNIEFYVDPVFYKGELLELVDAVKILRRATIANLVGKKIVMRAVKEGYIHPDAILWINDVPHAQYVLLK